MTHSDWHTGECQYADMHVTFRRQRIQRIAPLPSTLPPQPIRGNHRDLGGKHLPFKWTHQSTKQSSHRLTTLLHSVSTGRDALQEVTGGRTNFYTMTYFKSVAMSEARTNGILKRDAGGNFPWAYRRCAAFLTGTTEIKCISGFLEKRAWAPLTTRIWRSARVRTVLTDGFP